MLGACAQTLWLKISLWELMRAALVQHSLWCLIFDELMQSLADVSTRKYTKVIEAAADIEKEV